MTGYEMRMICSECGNEIPEGSDFCYHCGRGAKDAVIIDAGNTEGKCSMCGNDLVEGGSFCRRCGAPSGIAFQAAVRPRMVKNAWIGLLLALVPGFFDIYGLGHFFHRKWRRGLLYLMASVPLFYLTHVAKTDPMVGTMVFMISLFMYFVQTMEVLSYSFTTDSGNK